MPARTDDVDAGTRMAIAELRADFLALRDEINQWCADVLGRVNAIAEGLTRPSGPEVRSDGTAPAPSKADARPDDGELAVGQSCTRGSDTHPPVTSTAVASSSSITTLPTPEADYNRLFSLGVHHRQNPLRLILRMFEKGKNDGTAVDTSSVRGNGFRWKDAGMAPKTLRDHARPTLVEAGYVEIPVHIPISEEARKGKAKRRADVAGPGHLTLRGEAVARYMKDNGITDAVLKKGRRKRT